MFYTTPQSRITIKNIKTVLIEIDSTYSSMVHTCGTYGLKSPETFKHQRFVLKNWKTLDQKKEFSCFFLSWSGMIFFLHFLVVVAICPGFCEEWCIWHQQNAHICMYLVSWNHSTLLLHSSWHRVDSKQNNSKDISKKMIKLHFFKCNLIFYQDYRPSSTYCTMFFYNKTLYTNHRIIIEKEDLAGRCVFLTRLCSS